MQTIGEALQKTLFREPEKPVYSEMQAKVNEIAKLVPLTKRYGYGYWAKLAQGYSYGDILAILKEVKNANAKYPKGGLLTNILRKKKC